MRSRTLIAILLLLTALVSACSVYRMEKELAPVYAEFLAKVRYLITSEERRDFLALPDADKPAFIEDFWKRRDPDPTTEENELRDRVRDPDRRRRPSSSPGEGQPGYADRPRPHLHPLRSARRAPDPARGIRVAGGPLQRDLVLRQLPGRLRRLVLHRPLPPVDLRPDPDPRAQHRRAGGSVQGRPPGARHPPAGSQAVRLRDRAGLRRARAQADRGAAAAAPAVRRHLVHLGGQDPADDLRGRRRGPDRGPGAALRDQGVLPGQPGRGRAGRPRRRSRSPWTCRSTCWTRPASPSWARARISWSIIGRQRDGQGSAEEVDRLQLTLEIESSLPDGSCGLRSTRGSTRTSTRPCRSAVVRS